MLGKLYNNYFAKDKMLRHLTQHILVATAGLIILFIITRVSINSKTLLVFLAFTYIPDIDGFTSIFVWKNKNPMAKKTFSYLKKLQFQKALSYSTVHHKKLNRLLFHNFAFYTISWLIFIWSVNTKMFTISIVFASMLAHFTFDWLDDIYQMGHIKNWLWIS